MGFFDASRRPTVRENGDVYREKADRFIKEADQFVNQGRLPEAEERIRQLVSLQSRVVGDRHPEYATGLCRLAAIMLMEDELTDAEPLLQRALEIRKKALGEDHPEYAEALDLLGRLMLRWEDFAGAEPLLRKALEVRGVAYGKDHPDYAASLGLLAAVVGRSEKADEAEPLLRESVVVRKRVLGQGHPDYAESLAELARFLQSHGDLAEAEPLLREALEVRKHALGEAHPDYVDTLSSLAGLLQSRGEMAEAEPLWRLLLDTRRQSLGDKHPECANILSNLASLLLRRGDLKGAEQLSRQAVEVRKHALGERHPEYATSLVNLASVLQRLGDLTAAEPLLRQALAIRKDVLGNRHPEYAASLMNLAQLVQKRGDITWAKMLMKEAAEVRRVVLGENHPDYAQSLAALAEVLGQQGETGRAEAMLREALEIRRSALGENHPAFAATLSSLAALARKLGHIDDAEELLREALQIRQDVLGEDHPDYATNLGNLAWVLQHKGQRQAAEALLTEALAIRERLYGAKHPDYLQNLERLNRLRGEVPHGPARVVGSQPAERQEPPPAAPRVDPMTPTPAAPASARGFDAPAEPPASADPEPPLPVAPPPPPPPRAKFLVLDDVHAPETTREAAPGHYLDDALAALDGEEDLPGFDVSHPAHGGVVEGHAIGPVDLGKDETDAGLSAVVETSERLANEWPDEKVAAEPEDLDTHEYPVAHDPSAERFADSETGTSADRGFDDGPTAPPVTESRHEPIGSVLPVEEEMFQNDTRELEAVGEDRLTRLAHFDEEAREDPTESHAGFGEMMPEGLSPVILGSAADHEPPSARAAVEDEDEGEGVAAVPEVEVTEFGASDLPTRNETGNERDAAHDRGTEPETLLTDSRPSPARDASLSGAWNAVEVMPSRSLSMTQSSSDLSQELAAMSDRFSELGERLLTAARHLHAPGALPDSDLLDAVSSCRHDFLSFRDETCKLASSLHVEHPPAEHLASLQDISTLLDELVEAELHQSKSEKTRQRALWTLDRVLALSHASTPDFDPLRECHEKAGSLRDSIVSGSWRSLPAEADHLAQGEHAFAHLVTLIEDRDELSDEHWASLHESVGTAFGKPLAAAAARAKIRFARDHAESSPHGEVAFSGSHH